MSAIQFRARWREELEAVSPDGRLVFEFTAGRKHVYFPDQERWLALAPEWARDRWAVYLEACQAWCAKERIPMTIVGDAHFHAEC